MGSPNAELLRLREDVGLSQQELADELNALARDEFGRAIELTKKSVGRWERGEVAWPQPFYRRLLAAYFERSIDDLGFRRAEPVSELLPEPRATPDPVVAREQTAWRDVRRRLGQRRRELAVRAQRLYPDAHVAGLAATGVIAPPHWLPAEPVPIERVALDLDAEAGLPIVTGREAASADVRPLTSADARYQRYSHAVRDLAAPRLLENRLCYRLLGVDWTAPRLRYGLTGFFDGLDVNESLAHELASDHDALPFRELVGDPFDLRRRSVLGAIGTLTIRGGSRPTMVLHQRDGERVSGGGGMAHLLPAGIFQPSSVRPECVAADFSLWRNIQRELVEELLGDVDCDGAGEPIRYDECEPFVAMDAALRDGRLRVHCLGVVVDALTLAADLLTVAVIEPDVYDELFADAVASNDEGSIPARALPFDADTITRLLDARCLSPGASAALRLAWRWRGAVLGQRSSR